MTTDLRPIVQMIRHWRRVCASHASSPRASWGGVASWGVLQSAIATERFPHPSLLSSTAMSEIRGASMAGLGGGCGPERGNAYNACLGTYSICGIPCQTCATECTVVATYMTHPQGISTLNGFFSYSDCGLAGSTYDVKQCTKIVGVCLGCIGPVAGTFACPIFDNIFTFCHPEP